MDHNRRWPWVAQQGWNDVLFLHWQIPYEELRRYVPAPFKLETFNGQAWITIVLFRATNSRLRGMPRLISYPSFLQLNVRTYVMFNDEPGIYFFKIDANSPFVVAGAKLASLPYQQAKISMEKNRNGLLFNSQSKNSKFPSTSLSASYQPLPGLVNNQQGTLSHWLTERYSLWFIKGNKILKGPISHKHWTLQKAEVNFKATGMLPFLNDIYFQEKPLVQYSKSIQAHLYPFEKKGVFNQDLKRM